MLDQKKLEELRSLVEGLGGNGFADQDEEVAEALTLIDSLMEANAK